MRVELKVDRIISVVAVFISAIALVIAFQSNRIASRQASPEIAIVELSEVESGESPISVERWKRDYSCKHRLRLTNLGGAATAIVGYQVNVFYDGRSSVSPQSGDNHAQAQLDLIEGLQLYGSRFIAKDAPVDVEFVPEAIMLEEIYPSLPIGLEAYNTVDLMTVSMFRADTRYVDLLSSVDYYEDLANDFLYWSWNPVDEGYKPIEYSYTLYLATDQALSTPRATCYLVRKDPNLPTITQTPDYWWTPTPVR